MKKLWREIEFFFNYTFGRYFIRETKLKEYNKLMRELYPERFEHEINYLKEKQKL